MPSRNLRFTARDSVVIKGLEEIRSRMKIPEGFPPEVMAEAESVEPSFPDHDLTDIPFVTIDPPGSRDLDQALYLERRGDGYRVRYAIADVASFVTPGGAMDTEARGRGLTKYGPDRRTLLYPGSLSEGSGSLLPGELRPAVVWTLDLDPNGELVGTTVHRARVRSREQLDYGTVQLQLDSGAAPEHLQLLAEVGRIRQIIEQERGAVTLPIPDQQVVRANGGWELVYSMPLPVEGWNAQISLLTGMAAAGLMVDADVGLLRTLPPARQHELDWMRRVAKALSVNWPKGMGYPDLIRSLNARIPAHAALLAEATNLFSGAGYQVLGSGTTPNVHSALATTYAHATAPLRRLVDRFVSETCLSIYAGLEIPGWVTEGLPALPEVMSRAGSIAGSYEAACLNLVEAAVLSNRVGGTFTGVVVDVDPKKSRGDVQVREPVVHARINGDELTLGLEIGVRLIEASVADQRVVFERV